MTAKTGHDRQTALMQRGRLADLFATATTLMQGGKRNEVMCEHLERALQLFKENRLAGVTAGFVNPAPENVLELLSIPIHEFLPRHSANYYLDRGVDYIGELYLRQDWQTSRIQAAQQCRDSLASLGLPFKLDLDSIGWIPPYATDPQVLSTWNMRMHIVRHAHGRGQSCAVTGGCSTIGEYLRQPLISQHATRSWVLTARDFGFRLGMYVPPSWTAPPRDEQGCREYGQEIWCGEHIPSFVKRMLEKTEYTSFEQLAELSYLELDKLLGRSGALEMRPLLRKYRLSPNNAQGEKALDMSVDFLELSIRAQNCFRDLGIRKVRDILKRTEAEFLRTPNFSRRTLNEIKEVLANMGLTIPRS